MCNGLFPRRMESLKSIPGVSERSATAIPAEAGGDPSSFQDAAHPVSWAASRTQGSFFNKFSHAQAVVRRKPRMKVQVAIARKAPVAAWLVLHDGVPYREPSKNDSVPAPTQG